MSVTSFFPPRTLTLFLLYFRESVLIRVVLNEAREIQRILESTEKSIIELQFLCAEQISRENCVLWAFKMLLWRFSCLELCNIYRNFALGKTVPEFWRNSASFPLEILIRGLSSEINFFSFKLCT